MIPPKKKIPGHGGHGLPTPPPGGISRHVSTQGRPTGPQPQYNLQGRRAHPPPSGRESELAASEDILSPVHIAGAIANALRGKSRVPQWVLDIPGFSTPTMRRLWSNLLYSKRDVHYLEVGLYCGGTFAAALAGNTKVSAIGFEDFSQPFDRKDVREQWLKTMAALSNGGAKLSFLPQDFFDYVLRPPTDVFFYDGNHGREFQAKALEHALPGMANRFLFIVDDYNWADVTNGTQDGFDKLGAKVDVRGIWELSDQQKNDGKHWHNGVAIFLCEKCSDSSTPAT